MSLHDGSCSECRPLAVLLEKASAEAAYHVYFDVVRYLSEMEKQGIIELYAGDCPLKEAKDLVESEKLYTVYHYVRCIKCHAIYKLGVCIRSSRLAVGKFSDIKEDNAEHRLNGRYGTFFEESGT